MTFFLNAIQAIRHPAARCAAARPEGRTASMQCILLPGCAGGAYDAASTQAEGNPG
jgi:hypothetical protein